MVTISVVTPSFNSMPFIHDAINSVLIQGVDRVEHIVVDGASTDGTVEVLASYPHLRWISEPDKGQTDALNKGFRMAQGDIIAWLNADDAYPPNTLPRVLRCFEDHPELDLIYGDLWYVDALRRPLRRWRPVRDIEIEGLMSYSAAIFWRKRLFDKVGYLDETFNYCADLEFYLRVAPVAQVYYLPEVLLEFRLHERSKSVAAEIGFNRERCLIYERAFELEPYLSRVPTRRKHFLLANSTWRCGLDLARAGRIEESAEYLRKAIDCYHVWDFGNTLTIEPIIYHYLTFEVRPKSDCRAWIAALPLYDAERQRLLDALDRSYAATRFYLAMASRQRRRAILLGFRAVLEHPSYLSDRGFMSNWAKLILGERLFAVLKGRFSPSSSQHKA